MQLGVWLKQHNGKPWSRQRFFIVRGGNIVYVDPQIEGVGCIEIEPVATDAVCLLQQLKIHRDTSDIGMIRRNRYVMRNEWVVVGTRIPVWMIQDLHASVESTRDIVRTFPILTDADIREALAFDIPDVVALAS